jgi:hypothetical protein
MKLIVALHIPEVLLVWEKRVDSIRIELEKTELMVEKVRSCK